MAIDRTLLDPSTHTGQIALDFLDTGDLNELYKAIHNDNDNMSRSIGKIIDPRAERFRLLQNGWIQLSDVRCSDGKFVFFKLIEGHLTLLNYKPVKNIYKEDTYAIFNVTVFSDNNKYIDPGVIFLGFREYRFDILQVILSGNLCWTDEIAKLFNIKRKEIELIVLTNDLTNKSQAYKNISEQLDNIYFNEYHCYNNVIINGSYYKVSSFQCTSTETKITVEAWYMPEHYTDITLKLETIQNSVSEYTDRALKARSRINEKCRLEYQKREEKRISLQNRKNSSNILTSLWAHLFG